MFNFGQILTEVLCLFISSRTLFAHLLLYAQGELRIARGKFSQLKEQAKENKVIAASKMNDTFFQNSEKTLTPVNTTQTLADELKTSTDTASRIIQIQAKADGFGFGVAVPKTSVFGTN